MLNAKTLVADGLELVTLPEVYLEVKRVLEDPRSSATDMARAIEQDPALCARLLGMANSAFFGFAAEVGTIPRAVSLLGTLQVHDLVLASTLATTFSEIRSDALDMPVFWADSVRRAVGAKVLAGRCNLLDGDRVFVAGLLAHIGVMVLALRAPQALEHALDAAADRRQTLAHTLAEMYGTDYAEIGAELLAAWRMPAALEAVVRHHTNPRTADDFQLETAIVHVAAALAGPAPERLDETALALLPLDDTALEGVPAETDRQAGEVLALLYPAQKTA